MNDPYACVWAFASPSNHLLNASGVFGIGLRESGVSRLAHNGSARFNSCFGIETCLTYRRWRTCCRRRGWISNDAIVSANLTAIILTRFPWVMYEILPRPIRPFTWQGWIRCQWRVVARRQLPSIKLPSPFCGARQTSDFCMKPESQNSAASYAHRIVMKTARLRNSVRL